VPCALSCVQFNRDADEYEVTDEDDPDTIFDVPARNVSLAACGILELRQGDAVHLLLGEQEVTDGSESGTSAAYHS
jgi:hypothetical protein